jgi:hypothetical protein
MGEILVFLCHQLIPHAYSLKGVAPVIRRLPFVEQPLLDLKDIASVGIKTIQVLSSHLQTIIFQG